MKRRAFIALSSGVTLMSAIESLGVIDSQCSLESPINEETLSSSKVIYIKASKVQDSLELLGMMVDGGVSVKGNSLSYKINKVPYCVSLQVIA